MLCGNKSITYGYNSEVEIIKTLDFLFQTKITRKKDKQKIKIWITVLKKRTE